MSGPWPLHPGFSLSCMPSPAGIIPGGQSEAETSYRAFSCPPRPPPPPQPRGCSWGRRRLPSLPQRPAPLQLRAFSGKPSLALLLLPHRCGFWRDTALRRAGNSYNYPFKSSDSSSTKGGTAFVLGAGALWRPPARGKAALCPRELGQLPRRLAGGRLCGGAPHGRWARAQGRLFREEQQSTGVHAQPPALSLQSIGCGAAEACCPELRPHLSSLGGVGALCFTFPELFSF